MPSTPLIHADLPQSVCAITITKVKKGRALRKPTASVRCIKPCGIGVDIVEISRIRNIKHLGRFAEFFLTASELQDFKKSLDPLRFVASRFAAKEAVIKAFPEKISPQEFAIIKKRGKPTVHFLTKHGRKCRYAFVSLSHEKEYAVGYATIY